ncbi:exodeoxyribonuclease VII, large subunit [Halobacteroides halobius DSM 5150]|uniref:Exodeoxyribonuclease 7 large subunit n=1 Tax=Halobacteroides halobius (strain ATCC 35273 / DSM 5150 / MD-1) TaxID=748449 RepID=L0K678_HALHC|nr:exodeoxyribonuclease VII large subunit [Halobacteroides halobius]AGB40526.1 exodeoxyribonuclease VII, large subunit [Halobacteroides halobius DSM 5150]
MEDILSVSQITAYIKERLISDSNLREVVIKGEVSNYYQHSSSGHIYFTLKDKRAKLKAVMFNDKVQNLDFDLEDGREVVAQGRISLYSPQGQHQIQVKSLKPAGVGALHIAFKRLKEKLAQEGLFAEEYKQSIPQIPKRVGVVTSPTGAAFRDIISVIKRRFSNTSLLIAPATVQGKRAENSLIRALRLLHNYDLNVIIIGRGGGSLEDLWAFNKEELARVIFNSKIPIISAVGHETDYTISDYVADLRAPTPSAAAELVVADRKELQRYLKRLENNLYQAIDYKFQKAQDKLNYLTQRRVFELPQQEWQQLAQQLDELSKRLDQAVKEKLKTKQKNLQTIMDQLNTLSPLQVLERGYSLTRKSSDKAEVNSITQVQEEELVEVILKDGKLDCKVREIKK